MSQHTELTKPFTCFVLRYLEYEGSLFSILLNAFAVAHPHVWFWKDLNENKTSRWGHHSARTGFLPDLLLDQPFVLYWVHPRITLLLLWRFTSYWSATTGCFQDLPVAQPLIQWSKFLFALEYLWCEMMCTFPVCPHCPLWAFTPTSPPSSPYSDLSPSSRLSPLSPS